MLQVGYKAVFRFKFIFYISEDIFFAINTAPALTADKVMVVPFFGVVIYVVTVKLALQYAAGLLQQIQRAIHSGFIHARGPCVNELDNIFSGQVRGVIMDTLKYYPALRREPHTFLLQYPGTTHSYCNQLLL